MLKKIYLFWIVICISIFHTLTTYAQTCDLAPTCAELGFSQTTAECTDKKTLHCPFDKTAVFCGEAESCIKKDCSRYTLASCPDGLNCERCKIGCGDDLIRYKKEDAIILLVDVSANQKLTFTASGGSLTVNWGDGTIDSNQTHTYTTAGNYQVKITGTITSLSFSSSTINDMQMISLTLPSITSLSFENICTKMTGSIPEIPSGLTTGYNMFRNCSKLTGNIPDFPDSLTYGYGMFYECNQLTGSIPPLPSNLTSGFYMFRYCSGLTGTAPPKPSGLTSYTKMFSGTQVTNDGSWPDNAW